MPLDKDRRASVTTYGRQSRAGQDAFGLFINEGEEARETAKTYFNASQQVFSRLLQEPRGFYYRCGSTHSAVMAFYDHEQRKISVSNIWAGDSSIRFYSEQSGKYKYRKVQPHEAAGLFKQCRDKQLLDQSGALALVSEGREFYIRGSSDHYFSKSGKNSDSVYLASTKNRRRLQVYRSIGDSHMFGPTPETIAGVRVGNVFSTSSFEIKVDAERQKFFIWNEWHDNLFFVVASDGLDQLECCQPDVVPKRIIPALQDEVAYQNITEQTFDTGLEAYQQDDLSIIAFSAQQLLMGKNNDKMILAMVNDGHGCDAKNEHGALGGEKVASRIIETFEKTLGQNATLRWGMGFSPSTGVSSNVEPEKSDADVHSHSSVCSLGGT